MGRTGAELTHAELVAIARRWLRSQRCCVVITEMTSAVGETPDAIGWRSGAQSIVVECKRTWADFRADGHKPSRRRGGWPGLGTTRFYLVPTMLAAQAEVALVNAGSRWGLLVTAGRGVRKALPSGRHETDPGNEARLLISAMRRIGSGVQAVAVVAYTIDTQGPARATLGIQPEPAPKAGQ